MLSLLVIILTILFVIGMSAILIQFITGGNTTHNANMGPSDQELYNELMKPRTIVVRKQNSR